MNLVKAIIRPHWLSEFSTAMNRLGIDWMYATEVKGYGRQAGRLEYYRGVKFEHDFISKFALEMLVTDRQLEAVLGATVDAVNTGYEGDGKIFVLNVQQL